MPLTLVEHNEPQSALHGAMAAIVAQARGAGAMHLPVAFDGAHREAVQYVTAEGALGASGLVWFERAGVSVAHAATPGEIVGAARAHEIVVPIGAGASDPGEVSELLVAAADAGIAVARIRVDVADGVFRLVGAPTDEPPERHLYTRDGYGRLGPQEPGRLGPKALKPLRILLVGDRADHRHVNPATLAALGDAADATGSVLDVTFAAPAEVRADNAAGMVASADGVVLPGGAGMAVVPAQILIAGEAMNAGKPAVGLCLGMQTMTTAVFRRATGRCDATLAEVDPHAGIKTFVPLTGETAERHRLGEQAIVTSPGSRLRALLGPNSAIRSNHRFKLDLDLIPTLESKGLTVTARSIDGAIAEGIELNGHPFFIGMQGHPELKSRKGVPHPLLTAFVDAAASARA